jgi:hypothetical protein
MVERRAGVRRCDDKRGAFARLDVSAHEPHAQSDLLNEVDAIT